MLHFWHHRVLTLLVVVLITSLTSACGSKGPSSRDERALLHYDIASDLLKKGELAQAIVQIQEAIKLDPKDPHKYGLQGLIFLNRGLINQAENSFQEAIRLKPDYSEAYNNLCGLYITTALWDQAIQNCEKAVENITYATPEKPYLNMGWAHYKKGTPMKAVESFKKSLMHRPGFYLAHQHLGTVYFDLGKYKLAAESFGKAVEGCKICAEPFYKLGLTLFKINKRNKALSSFRKCRELDKEGSIGKLCGNFLKKYQR